jgi:hypothetical protein
MAIQIQKLINTLNKLSPDELQDKWMTCSSQAYIQVAILEVKVPIDVHELDRLSEDKIKALIHNRMISALKDKLTVLTEKGFINR